MVDSERDDEDLWGQALKTLSAEDQEQYNVGSQGMLETLRNVQEATENRKLECVRKGWRVYRNKQGEEVKLRHVLEKIFVWTKEIMKIVDVGVSFDQSGHAALPWAIVKHLITIGGSEINLFSHVAEGVESISSLIARYTIIETLYRNEDCEAKSGYYEAIEKLYAAILTYLARVKSYFVSNTWKRFGRSLIEVVRKQYDELWVKISETDVENWTQLVDRQLQGRMREDATEHYQSLKDTLLVLNKPIVHISDQISIIQDNLNREERTRIFRWMSEIEYRSHHDDLSKDLLDQSGQWLLESQEFIQWGQSSVSSVFWLHGIPGSGKTRLVSRVINIMHDVDPASKAPQLGFFYCARSTAEPERAKPVDIMGALLRQVTSSKPDLPIKECVAKEYEIRRRKADEDCSALKKLTVEDCTRLITEVAKETPVTIIIDALDECEEDKRYQLLEALDYLINHSLELVKVFISSRDDIDLALHLEHCKNISISAENNGGDIARFVHSEAARMIKSRLLLDGKVSNKTQDKIVNTLIDGAQGMFRWVAMSLEYLQGIKYRSDFMNRLGHLPEELSGLYEVIYKQIDLSESYGRDVAIKTLKWLLCAQRLLSVEELIAAIPVAYEVIDQVSSDSNEDSESENEYGPSPVRDVLRLCRNLVVVDSKKRVFRFAHQSVREYLQRRQEYTEKEQHSFATVRCLDVYLAELSPASLGPNLVQQNRVLKSYAEIYWPLHYKYVEDYDSDELRERILLFAKNDSKRSPLHDKWASDMRARIGDEPLWDSSRSLGLAHADPVGEKLFFASFGYLSTACAFGLTSFIKASEPSLADLNHRYIIDSRENEAYTLLAIAAEQGEDQMVQLLLREGVDISALSKEHSALEKASGRGHEHVVRTLLDNGANIEASTRHRGTALISASEAGETKLVQLLLSRGANVNACGGYFGTALNVAAGTGHMEIVQLLLDNGASMDIQSKNIETALTAASAEGEEEVVQLLLKNGANVNAQDGRYGNALSVASSSGHKEVVQLLLDHGANINAQGGRYGNVLSAASSSGHKEVVQLLLDHGADINARGGFYGNALSTASSSGDKEVVQLLLDHRAEVNAQGGFYGNALSTASSSGDKEVVQLLLDHRAEVNAQGGELGNALSAASCSGDKEVVQLLLDHRAEVNAQGGNFGNALSAASYYGHEEVVQLLLVHGAAVNAQGGRFGNALGAASRKGHEHVVQLLLERGAEMPTLAIEEMRVSSDSDESDHGD